MRSLRVYPSIRMYGSITSEAPSIFDHLSALSDSTRGRLLLVLEGRELTVGELCSILQLPQSTVSRHLKVLADGGWIASRRDGTARFYTHSPDDLDPQLAELWQTLKEPLTDLPSAVQDGHRIVSVLAERRQTSREFFSSAAGEWDRLRQELFGERMDLLPLLGLLDESWVVGDLGCGTGQVSSTLAPFVGRVIAVDGSEAMLDAARAGLAAYSNVELRQGELEALPLDDDSLDVAVLFLVLHHVAEPVKVLAEVARVTRDGGKLLIVDMTPHDRHDYRQEMGHLWLGFDRDQLTGWLRETGFSAPFVAPLAPDPKAKGPALFIATARREARESVS